MRSVRCPIAVSETRGEVAESYGLEGVAHRLDVPFEPPHEVQLDRAQDLRLGLEVVILPRSGVASSNRTKEGKSISAAATSSGSAV